MRSLFFIMILSIFNVCFWSAYHTLNNSKIISPHKIVLTGTIITIPIKKKYRVNFIFKPDKINLKYIYISWYSAPDNISVAQRWKLPLRLKKPHSLSNKGSFDFEKWCFQHHISLIGYVRNKNSPVLLSSKKEYYFIQQIREQIANKIEIILKNNKNLPLILALTLGIQQYISKKQWNILQRTGTSHLMAVSGLHVGMLASIGFFVTRTLSKFFPQYYLLISVERTSIIGGFILALLYSLLAGLSIPTERALLMLAIILLTRFQYRYFNIWQAFFLTLFIICITSPLEILSMSFCLSFSAVFFLIYVFQYQKNMKMQWLRAQWVVMTGLFPLSLFFFQKTSVISILANIIAIPFVGFIILPISLFALLFLFIKQKIAIYLFLFSNYLLEFLWKYLSFLSQWKYALWYKHIHSAGILISLMLAVLLLLGPKGLPARWCSILILTILITYKKPGPKQNEVWMHILDVGQGLSAIIQTKNHLLVYDTGGRWGDDFDMGSAVVVPFLRTLDRKKIDKVIISHLDMDHLGGLISLIKGYPISLIQTSNPLKLKKQYPRKRIEYCKKGEKWDWDGVSFEFLLNVQTTTFKTSNNRSCVLYVKLGKTSILLPGDIEKMSEKQLVRTYGDDLKATVLIAPHHGSNTSSAKDFLDAVKPEYVVFPVGFENRFGFPKKEVIKRYKVFNVELFNTAKHGEITFKFNRIGLISPVFSERNANHHFWNH